jgi:hypothetical protein
VKKLIVLASLIFSIQSSFAVGAAIALTADSVCETFNGYGNCQAQLPVGLGGALTTSTFAGATAGLIVLADGNYSINEDAAYALCDSAASELTKEEAMVKDVVVANGICE